MKPTPKSDDDELAATNDWMERFIEIVEAMIEAHGGPDITGPPLKKFTPEEFLDQFRALYEKMKYGDRTQ